MISSTSTTSSLLAQVADAQTITAKSRSNFSSAFLFLPAVKRRAIRNVYAFFRVIDDVVDEESDAARQRELLDAWKRELVAAYKGTTIVPLLKELKETIDLFAIPQQHFLMLIEGCEMDITQKRYETFDDLYQYCYRVASMVGLVCMKIFEYESPTADQAAVNLGLALQLTNIIRDVGVDLKKGRIYLPQEDLKKFGVSEANLQANKGETFFLALMDFQYQRAEAYYQKGIEEFKKDTGKKLLAARIMAEVYRALLKKIRRKKYPVLTQRVSLTLPEKLMILASCLTRHYLK